MAVSEINLSFDKYPTFQRLAESDAFIKAIIGPAGSAKTTNMIKLLIQLGMLQEPASDGVSYTRWLILRNTNKQLKNNTWESFKNTMSELMLLTESVTSPYIRAVVNIPITESRSANIEFWFWGMDSENSQSDVLGAEYTGVLYEEVSELREEIVKLAASRIGRYPSGAKGKPTWTGALMTTNGPSKSHWLYRWATQGNPAWAEIEAVTGRKYFELFSQPPALLRPAEGDKSGAWKPNPLAENVENLPGNYAYYYNMLGSGEDIIIAYVEGYFSDIRKGKVVFTEFSKALHVVDESKISVPKNADLYLSFDFGRTPVMLVGVETEDGSLLITDEVRGEDISIGPHYRTACLPLLRRKYPYSSVVFAWGDPAGADNGQAEELSPFSVLQKEGLIVDIPWDTRNKLEPRLEAVRNRLTQLSHKGKPQLLISSACVDLIKALNDYYVYVETKSAGDKITTNPTKVHPWSDLADALQYMCMGFFLNRATNKLNMEKRDDGRYGY